MCKTCARNSHESGPGLEKCPLCREPFTEYNASRQAAQCRDLAERGVTWAQADVGKHMVFGKEGFQKEEKTGLEWINKAAAKDHPIPLFQIYTFYRDGLASVQRETNENANELLLKSANLGHSVANSELAKFYTYGEAGFEKDPDEAYFRASVAFALDDTNVQAAEVLGILHLCEDIPEPSHYLECYYLNIATNEDKNGLDSCLYGLALETLSSHMHNGRSLVPGSNVVPSVMFWLRKSRDMGFDDARQLLKDREARVQSRCANCSKLVQGAERFKQCSKCRANGIAAKNVRLRRGGLGTIKTANAPAD